MFCGRCMLLITRKFVCICYCVGLRQIASAILHYTREEGLKISVQKFANPIHRRPNYPIDVAVSDTT
jgi:hypothetical protein